MTACLNLRLRCRLTCSESHGPNSETIVIDSVNSPDALAYTRRPLLYVYRLCRTIIHFTDRPIRRYNMYRLRAFRRDIDAVI